MGEYAGIDRLCGDLVALAHCAPSHSEYRDAVLSRIARDVGCETAILMPRLSSQPPATIGKSRQFAEIYRHFRLHESLYLAELTRGRRVLATGEAYIDTQIYSLAERSRMRFFAEVVRPQGVTSRVVGHVTFRGCELATIQLCRHGRSSAFDDRALQTMGRVMPLLGLTYGALRHAAPEETSMKSEATRALTARQRQIADLVQHGYQNKEIAVLLQVSPYTVRNHLAEIFRKVKVETRTALAIRNATGSSP